MGVSKAAAPKVLSVISAVLEAHGALKVATDAKASALSALMALPAAAATTAAAGSPLAVARGAASQAEDASLEAGSGGSLERPGSSGAAGGGEASCEGQRGTDREEGRPAKRRRAVLVGKFDGSQDAGFGRANGKGSSGDAGGRHVGTYELRVAVFQEASNRVAVSASIAGSAPLSIAENFTDTLKAVQADVGHIVSGM